METRKYFLDWLRVAAFGLLIIFHVGMLYVSWQYNLKSPRLYPAIEPLMNAVSAWRLALLFLISGVASCYLIDRLGPGAFALDRLRRLLPVILTGMYVVIPPQTYIVLVSRGATHMDFLTFWWTQYLRANQVLVRPFHMTMPTWDHIWFLVYLLIYTLMGAATVWTARRMTEAVLPVYVLHQPILLVTAYWLFPLVLPLPVEALLLAGTTGLGSFAIYEGLIRPIPFSRFLFGLKPKTKTKTKTKAKEGGF